MIVNIKGLSNDREVLSGSANGAELLAKLLKVIKEPEEADVLFLDFWGIAAATASFLRDGPLAFRSLLRQKGSLLYPVVANGAEPILEDLDFILTRENDALLSCEVRPNGKVKNVRLLGRLDEKQRHTYDLIKKIGPTDAESLARTDRSSPVGRTAWNNRLSGLKSKGLITESIVGRRKQFRIAVEE